MALGSDAIVATGTDEGAQRRIAAYYDTTQVLYSHLWSRTGVHYGLWDNGTRCQADAIRNMDGFVASRLGLARGRRVLDAGCGVGGTSLYLADEHGLEVVGITLSEDQLRRARRLTATSRAAVPPIFRRGDYLCTSYPDEFFDGVVAIESVCYAEEKRRFLAEAFRILSPGGRLVVADGFAAAPITARARAQYRRLLDGMALTDLNSVKEFDAGLRATGFVDVRCDDKTTSVQPSSRRILALSVIGVAICSLPCRLGLLPASWLAHGWAGIAQRPLFRDGTLAYCVFSASKPTTR